MRTSTKLILSASALVASAFAMSASASAGCNACVPYNKGATIIIIDGNGARELPTRKAETVDRKAPVAKATASNTKKKQNTPTTKKPVKETVSTTKQVKCRTTDSVAQYRLIWNSRANGNCDGWLQPQDISDLARVANNNAFGWGVDVSFYLPGVCHGKGGYAVIRATFYNNAIYPSPWSKIGCNRKGHQSIAELNPRLAYLFQ